MNPPLSAPPLNAGSILSPSGLTAAPSRPRSTYHTEDAGRDPVRVKPVDVSEPTATRASASHRRTRRAPLKRAEFMATLRPLPVARPLPKT